MPVRDGELGDEPLGESRSREGLMPVRDGQLGEGPLGKGPFGENPLGAGLVPVGECRSGGSP